MKKQTFEEFKKSWGYDTLNEDRFDKCVKLTDLIPENINKRWQSYIDSTKELLVNLKKHSIGNNSCIE